MGDASTTAARRVASDRRGIPPRASLEPRRAVMVAALVVGLLLATGAACSPSQPPPVAPPLPAAHEAGVEAGPDVATVDAASESSDVITVCNPVLCADNVVFAITLPVGAQVLATAKLVVAFGAERLEFRRPRPVDVESNRQVWKQPAFTTSQRVVTLSPSLSQLRLGIHVPPDLVADDLDCAVRVESDTGTVLLDVSRTMHPEPYSIPGACGDPCKDVRVRLYANSKSGLACGSKACEAGLELHLNAPRVMSQIDGGFVDVCRQQRCSRAKFEGLWVVQKLGTGSRIGLSGQLSGWIDYDSKSPDELVFEISAEPEALRDGDRYSLKFVKGSNVLGEVHHTVQYRSWYPNGQDCDTVPCRRGTVQSRL